MKNNILTKCPKCNEGIDCYEELDIEDGEMTVTLYCENDNCKIDTINQIFNIEEVNIITE